LALQWFLVFPKLGDDGAPMVSIQIRLASLLLLGLLLAGCYTDYGPVQVGTTVSGTAVTALLLPGEKLKITVYGEEALTGEYDINPGGYVSMPLIGQIRAAGQTSAEFGRNIAAKYRAGGYLQDPHVNVAVMVFKPFYVLGEAVTPGEYPYRSGLNVHSAVAMAGGFTYRASRTYILVRHVGEEVWKEYSLAEPVPIAPGDLIRVPERYF
jgi:protein involved in polysaccharide export with SLBB domain